MRLRLAIRAYEPDAVFDHFDDGSFEAFDVIVAEVMGGERTAPQLRILVEPHGELARSWNRPGAVLTVSVEPDQLTAQVLFASAFTIEGES